MDDPQVLEDERGVDIAQIRARLSLSVPERVQSMVDSVNRIIAMRKMADKDRKPSA